MPAGLTDQLRALEHESMGFDNLGAFAAIALEQLSFETLELVVGRAQRPLETNDFQLDLIPGDLPLDYGDAHFQRVRGTHSDPLGCPHAVQSTHCAVVAGLYEHGRLTPISHWDDHG